LARVQREIAMQKLISDLKKSQEELKLLSVTNPMTKLYNRRYFSEISIELLELVKRQKQPLKTLKRVIKIFVMI